MTAVAHPGADARLAAFEPSAVAPSGAAVNTVVRHGATLVASGQVAVRDGELVATGVVGDSVGVETAQHAAAVCAKNVLAAVRDAASSLDAVRLVRITVYVASAPGFADQHLVAHGASAAMAEVLGPERGRHSRAALGMAGLPLGSPVEVDAVFEILDDDS